MIWRSALFGMFLVLTTLSAPSAASDAPVPLLWSVKGKGDSRLLLLGSFHLLQERDQVVGQDVERAYQQADRLVFELSPDELDSPALLGQMLKAARRSSGRLQDDLSPEQWERLKAWAGQRAMPVGSLQLLQPWFVALTVNLHEMAASGMQPEWGVDRQLMQRARGDGKSMQGLEVGLAQLALFTGMDTATQVQMLDEALQETGDDADGTAAALYTAWRSGDAPGLWTRSGASMRADYPALYDEVNVRRNQAWLEQLPSWLVKGQGTTLMVVGAMHLLGDDGLVEQLRAQGYGIERVCTVAACPKEPRRRRR